MWKVVFYGTESEVVSPSLVHKNIKYVATRGYNSWTHLRPQPSRFQKSASQFKTTVPAMLSLLQVMTLDEWVNLLGPLFDDRPWTYGFFIIYISISGFAMMNMVTATVLEVGHEGTLGVGPH